MAIEGRRGLLSELGLSKFFVADECLLFTGQTRSEPHFTPEKFAFDFYTNSELKQTKLACTFRLLSVEIKTSRGHVMEYHVGSSSVAQ